MTSDVLISTEGHVGRIRLHRPQALHALTHAMCIAMADALLAWRDDPAVAFVLIDHAEGRGFCAGGDVRAAAASAAGDGEAARAFFRDEYRLNHLLFTYAKPIVAVMDGVVMGGGVGIALPARYRIATERTVLAMPEATIGLFPDVGGAWYLSRLPGRIGEYLALTAARLNGDEARALGLATHLAPAERIETFKARLLDTPVQQLEAALEKVAQPAGAAPILDRQGEIDRLFAGDDLETIVAACASTEQAPVVAAKSPLSMKVALRALRTSRGFVRFADEMRMEYAVVTRIIQRPDFAEGVRALLIDKDNAPRWNPATPESVTDHMLDTIFAPLPEDEQWEPF